MLKRTVREFNDDQGTDLAAALTYYSVLAIFPGLIALLSLVGVFGRRRSRSTRSWRSSTRSSPTPSCSRQVERRHRAASPTPPAPASVWWSASLGALWSASGYVGAFSRAMNRIYEVEEGRPFWRMRPMQLVVTVVTVVLCAVGLVILVVSGPVTESIGNALGVGSAVQTVWDIAKWPVLVVIVVVVVALLYWATPNVRFPSFRIISVGAFVAILVWLVASVGFAFYVSNFAPTTRPTARSPASSSRCCGCG